MAYRKAIDLAPDIAGETALSIASVYLRMNKLAEAEAHAQLGLKGSPAPAHILMGRVALARKRFDLAGAEARSAMQDQHYQFPASVLLAQALIGEGRLPEALALTENTRSEMTAVGHEPIVLLEFARGDALARMDRMGEAAEAFRNEIRLFPQGRQAYANLAVIYLLEKRVEDARRTMESLVKASPSAESHKLAIQTFEELGARDEAAAWRRRYRHAL